MVKSSLIIIFFLLNLYFDKIKSMSALTLILIFICFFTNKNFLQTLLSKKIRIFFIFYFLTFLVQIFFNQDGKVLWKIYSIYITEEGVLKFVVNFLRVLNLFFISSWIDYSKIFIGPLSKYQKIINNVIFFVPEVFIILKRKTKVKWFVRHILKQIMIKI